LTKATDQLRTERIAVRTHRSRVRYTVEGPGVNRVNRRERTRLGLSYSESMREGGEELGYRGVGNDREMGMRGGSEATLQSC
jgi:hypothetical protein